MKKSLTEAIAIVFTNMDNVGSKIAKLRRINKKHPWDTASQHFDDICETFEDFTISSLLQLIDDMSDIGETPARKALDKMLLSSPVRLTSKGIKKAKEQDYVFNSVDINSPVYITSMYSNGEICVTTSINEGVAYVRIKDINI